MGQTSLQVERTILHVDDDPALTRIVGARLRACEYDVAALNDPTLAMKTIIGGAFRVVVLDVAMPKIHGIELLRQIKAHDGGIQVIMLTGLLTMTTVLEAMRAGAEACFFKPVSNIDPLIGAIDQAFRKLDCWWAALDDLSRRRKSGWNDRHDAEAVMTVAASHREP